MVSQPSWMIPPNTLCAKSTVAVVAACDLLPPSSTCTSLGHPHSALLRCSGRGHSAWEGTIVPAHEGQKDNSLCPHDPQLKQMEVQLEEEYEDKQKALREKRELEGKLSTLSDQVRGGPHSYLLHRPKTGDLEDRKMGMPWYSAAGTISQGLMRVSSITQAFLTSHHDPGMPRRASLLILENVKIGKISGQLEGKISSQLGKDSRKSHGGAQCIPGWCPPR